MSEIKSIVDKVLEIKDEFFTLLNKYYPQYIKKYEYMYEKVNDPYLSADVKLRYCYEILRTWLELKKI